MFPLLLISPGLLISELFWKLWGGDHDTPGRISAICTKGDNLRDLFTPYAANLLEMGSTHRGKNLLLRSEMVPFRVVEPC